KRATEARRRILVLGRLAAAKRHDQPLSPLRLRNFRGAPFLLMSAEVAHIAEGKYSPAIAAWRRVRIPMKPATVSNRMSAIISSANSATHSIRNPAIHSNPKSATDSNGWPAAGGFWFSRYTK
ncbi:MAG: hypothetical protein AB7S53_12860, partial [Thiomonas sp.]